MFFPKRITNNYYWGVEKWKKNYNKGATNHDEWRRSQVSWVFFGDLESAV